MPRDAVSINALLWRTFTPAIVVVASLLFFVVFVLAPRKGLLARWRARRGLAMNHAAEDALRALAAAQAEQEQPLSPLDLALRKRWGRCRR